MGLNGFVRDLIGIPQFNRGLVWCTICGGSQRVDVTNAMVSGWPKCCGYTMTLDSPEEREHMSPTPHHRSEG